MSGPGATGGHDGGRADAGAASLAGRRVVVTRAVDQAGSLRRELLARGAEVIEVPVRRTAGPSDGGVALAAAADRLADGAYGWVVVTSTNGVRALAEALRGRAVPADVGVAAIGPATADAAAEQGWAVRLVPVRATAADLVATFPGPAVGDDAGPPSVLVAQAAEAGRVVVDGLRAAGWEVDAVEAYRSEALDVPDDRRRACADADAVTFASAGSVRAFLAAAGSGAVPPVVACIGPVTAAAAVEAGLAVAVVSPEATIVALVDALAGALAR